MAPPAVYTTLPQWDGQFKTRYAQRLSRALPSYALLQELIPFRGNEKLGLEFHQAVQVRLPGSVTYIKSQGGVKTLHKVRASKIVPAKVKGSQIVGRDAIEYEALFSGKGKDQAFSNTVDTVVEGLWELGRFRIEADLLYGQDELGVVKSVNSNTITFETAEWAPGIWTLGEGAEVEVFDSAGTTKRTNSDADNVMIINSIDEDARTITVDDAGSGIVQGDRVFFRSQRDTSEFATMVGLHELLLGTGTVLNIPKGTYSLWNNPVIDAKNGALLLDHILEGCAKVSVKGGYGSMCALVNPIAFANSIGDSAALRRYDQNSKIKKYIVGAEMIEFYTGTGKVEVKSHPMVKEGYAYCIPVSEKPQGGDKSHKNAQEAGYSTFYRVGASDLTFENLLRDNTSGKSNYFHALPDANAVELRTYSSQALFTGKLSRSFAIKNIVND